MTTPLAAMSLEQLAGQYAAATERYSVDDLPTRALAILAELRRRDALAKSNAERERRLLEAARRAEKFCGPGTCSDAAKDVYAALRAALAAYEEKTDG